MPYLVGVLLALAVSTFAAVVGLDRGRSFYATVLIVVASYYALFALIGGSLHALLIECIPISLFVLLSVAGFKFSYWLIPAGLAAHGLFDFAHPHLISNPGVPPWWPAFCASYDIAAAACLAVLIKRRQTATQSST